MKILRLALLVLRGGFDATGAAAPGHPNAAARPRLQITNGSAQSVDIFRLKRDTERPPSGPVAPGASLGITTTLGHRSAVVGRDDGAERDVSSRVPVQGFPLDPPDQDGVPAFCTQRVTAGGFPVVASACVIPCALQAAACLIDLMLAKGPDVRAAMIQSGARLAILAWNECTCDQPEWKRLTAAPVPDFPGISPRDYRDAGLAHCHLGAGQMNGEL